MSALAALEGALALHHQQRAHARTHAVILNFEFYNALQFPFALTLQFSPGHCLCLVFTIFVSYVTVL